MKVLAFRHFLVGIGVAMAVSAALAASPADAFELFGIKLFGKDAADEAEETIGEPQHYTLDFVVTGDEKDMEKSLSGASTLWNDRKKPASGAAGLLAKARGDYRAASRRTLRAGALRRHDFSIQIGGREAADMPPDATLAEPAAMTVTINPGPDLPLRQSQHHQPGADRRPTAMTASPRPSTRASRPARSARSGVILQAEALAVEAWREQGRPKARIDKRMVTADHETIRSTPRSSSIPGRLPPTVRSASRAPSAWTRLRRLDDRPETWTGIRSGRHRAGQQAAVAARCLPRAAHSGGRPDRARRAGSR